MLHQLRPCVLALKGVVAVEYKAMTLLGFVALLQPWVHVLSVSSFYQLLKSG